MFWRNVWFGLALLMLVLVIVTHPGIAVIGLCFLAWCGGVVSTLMVIEYRKALEPPDESL